MLIKLAPDKRDALAKRLCRDIQAGLDAKQGLTRRWERVENQYKSITEGGLRLVDDLDPLTLPLTKPKIDRIINTVFSAVTSIKPWVQVLPEDDASAAVSEKVEAALQYLAEKAGFERWFWRWLYRTAITNIGIPQIVFNPEKGIEFRSPHPKDFVAYPAAFSDPNRAKLLGHKCPMTGREITAQIRAGLFYKDAEFQLGYDPDSDLEGSHRDADMTASAHAIEGASEDIAEVWEVLVWESLKGGSVEIEGGAREIPDEEKRYVAVLDRGKQTLLALYEYGPSEPWYFDMRFDDEDDKFWPTSSVGHSLQGLQLSYDAIFNALFVGELMKIGPTTFIHGGQLGTKLKKYKPFEVIEVASAISVTQVQSTADTAGMSNLLNKLEEVADRQSRISTIGTGEQFKSGTTATESAGLIEMQRQAEDQYTAFVSLCLQKMWRFLYELLVLHFDELKQICGEAIPIEGVWELDGAKLSFEVNGKSSTNSPNALLAKLDRVIQYAGLLNQSSVDPNTGMPVLDPMTGMPAPPAIDLPKVIRLAIQALSLPISTEQIMPEPQQGGQLATDPGLDQGLLQAIAMAAGGAFPEEEAAEPLPADEYGAA
jgi:hypothetical protein